MKSLFILVFLASLLTQQTALASGGPVASNRFDNSLVGGQNSSSSFTASYGQLYRSTSQTMSFASADTWYPIPFNTFSPSSNMSGSTTSPATITIGTAGVYQINISIYFSSEESYESTFNQTTYTIGTKINSDSTVAGAAVYAGTAGQFSLNYNALAEFSAGDTIQFYIKTSATGGGDPFDNIVTLLNGYANLVQIAD